MIIKGRSRRDGGQLAAYLLRQDLNESVEVIALHEVAAGDLHGALREMEAVARLGTNCEKPLYHAQINPEQPLTPDQWAVAIERLEKELQLEGHQRAVVLHVKHGREHCHVVWNRVDSEAMRAVEMNWNYARHETVSRELEREFGHREIPGAHTGRAAGEERPVAKFGHAEQQQADRSGLDPVARKRQLTELWQGSDDGRAFVAALEDSGYRLARGERGYVVVDEAGEIHSLARQVEGARKKDIDSRLSDYFPLDRLPAADELGEDMRERWQHRQQHYSREDARPTEGPSNQQAAQLAAAQEKQDRAARAQQLREQLDRQRLQMDYRYQEQELPAGEIEKIAKQQEKAQEEAQRTWWERVKASLKGRARGPSLGMRLVEDLEERMERLQSMVRATFAHFEYLWKQEQKQAQEQEKAAQEAALRGKDGDSRGLRGDEAAPSHEKEPIEPKPGEPFDIEAAKARRREERRKEREQRKRDREEEGQQQEAKAGNEPFDPQAAKERRKKEREKERRQPKDRDRRRQDKNRGDRGERD